MIEAYAASQTAGALSSVGSSKEGKSLLIYIAAAVIVILALVDCVLLYLWISAAPQTRTGRKGEKEQKNPDQLFDYSAGDAPLEDFADPNGSKIGRQNGPWRFCSSPACTWLEAYLGEDVPDTKEPCDDFYSHVCSRHPHSVYAGGRTKLMAAVKDLLLKASSDDDRVRHSRPFWPEHAVVLQRCLDGRHSMLRAVDLASGCEKPQPQDCPSKVPEAPRRAANDFFGANPNATLDDFAAFIKREIDQWTLRNGKNSVDDDTAHTGSGSSPSPFPQRWARWACQWVSLASRCHLPRTAERNVQKLLTYQRLWKTIYFAPFMGRQGEPLLQLVYRSSPDARLQACMSIMADAFEEETLAATKQVLAGAVDDLENFLSELGKDTRRVVRNFFRFTTAQAAADSEYLAFPRDVLPGENGDVITTLLDPNDIAAVNFTLFSSQARISYKGQQRRLLVAPGLLGLLLNVSSSIGPVLVPTATAPVLRAMLDDRWLEEAQSMAPDRLVSSVAQCLATRVNMSEAMSRATAVESVVLEPLLQLYRKRLADTEGSGTLLHPGYSNGQLFFVLWALGHCGENGGAALVNAVARNSDRFAKAFDCPTDTGMFAPEKCPLEAAV